MPGIRVDGNDVLACYAVMAAAAGAGPHRRRPDVDRGGHPELLTGGIEASFLLCLDYGCDAARPNRP